jgi:ABC-type polysaccharide/polyol phosphate transport system ATPase subunit
MIIQITHDLSTLEESDRVIWLDHGKIFLDGSPKSVLIEYSQHAQRNMKL